MPLPKNLSVCTLLLLFIPQILFCQVSTEFWFAAPEVSINQQFDRPIRLVITAMSQNAQVTVEQPANGSFVPIVQNLSANTTTMVDLTNWIDQIENKPPDAVLNYGLHITSTAPISAYYEVVSSFCNCNPEIFVLKGQNAHGTEFYIPSQNFLDNSFLYNPTPYSSFDIVASENNTQVTIIPSANIVGHSAGVPFNITLNRGQTYSAQATSQQAANHLMGSYVTSDKPVSITVKDDLLDATFGNYGEDLGGDQIVPVPVVGTEYIAIRGYLANNNDRVFIIPTQNNTDIFTNGNVIPDMTISLGQVHSFNLNNPYTYIQSSAPVYIWQMSGFTGEIGLAILPQIYCTGSASTTIIRTNSSQFGITLLTKNGAQNNFLFNGNPGIINGADFSVVPGTGNQWVAALIDLTGNAPINTPIQITNTSDLFHLGVINASSGGGCRFGYFSNFSSRIFSQDTVTGCTSDSVLLDGGGNQDSYAWSTGDSTQSIHVNASGWYIVNTEKDGCQRTDSIYADLKSAPAFSLGNDTTVCDAQISLSVPVNNVQYLWSNGATTQSTNINPPGGNIWAEITDINGCRSSDTIQVTFSSQITVDLGNDTTLCNGGSMYLSAGNQGISYLWSSNENTEHILVLTTGTYWVQVTTECGIVSDSIYVEVFPALVPELQDTSVYCGTQSVLLDAGNQGASFHWSTGDTTQQISVTQNGTYSVEIISCNDTLVDSAAVTFVESDSSGLQLPNVFTPNGDGTNDVYSMIGNTATIQQFSIEIYNRWGMKVFTSNDVNISWDGLISGKEATSGVYYAILNYVDMCTPLKKTELKEYFTLVR